MLPASYGLLRALLTPVIFLRKIEEALRRLCCLDDSLPLQWVGETGKEVREMGNDQGGTAVKGRIRQRPATFARQGLMPLMSALEASKTALHREMTGFGVVDATAGNPADETDQAVLEQEVVFTCLLKQRTRVRLEQVEQAMRLLRRRAYGICQECRKPIPLERLKVQPDAVFCVPCKSQQEARY
jgi:DnaK suppressor protein